MPEYIPYFGLSSLIRKVEKLTKRKFPNPYDQFLIMAYEMIREGKMADFFTMVIEANHYFMSHRVLLLTKNLAEMLLKSKINVKLDHLRLPFSTFEVCFDKTMTIPNTNIHLPGVVCSFYESEVNQAFTTKFCQEITTKFHTPQPVQVIYPKRLVAFRMTDPRNKDIFTKATLIFNLDPDFAKDKDIEQVISEGPRLDSTDLPLDQTEKNIVTTVVKLALGAICYLNLENHESEAFKDRNRPRLGITPNIFLLGKRCISSAFMRKGHMRTLSHDRFKRDDAGFPRLVWWREHTVNPHGNLKEKDPKITEVEEEVLWK